MSDVKVGTSRKAQIVANPTASAAKASVKQQPAATPEEPKSWAPKAHGSKLAPKVKAELQSKMNALRQAIVEYVECEKAVSRLTQRVEDSPHGKFTRAFFPLPSTNATFLDTFLDNPIGRAIAPENAREIAEWRDDKDTLEGLEAQRNQAAGHMYEVRDDVAAYVEKIAPGAIAAKQAQDDELTRDEAAGAVIAELLK